MKEFKIIVIAAFLICLAAAGCGASSSNNSNGDADAENESDVPTAVYPKCGSGEYSKKYLIPGPGEEGYDDELAKKIRKHDRVFSVFNASAMNANTEAFVDITKPENKQAIKDFIEKDDGWDFEKYSGKKVEDVISGWAKTAGLYAGNGMAADALRYATLRDQGGDCEEIKTAIKLLTADLDALHIAFAIPGVKGAAARGFIKKSLPGDAKGITPVPLKDPITGKPLPDEKNNGTWRDDNSGLYPDYYWEDSVSRDMMLGWATATAVIWEVIKDDPAFAKELKDRLQADAKTLTESLRTVRESGYDLEFPDADGRITFHGYINEHNFEREYFENLNNGFYAVMALGIVAAYTYAAEDQASNDYLYNQLILERDLPGIALKRMIEVNMGNVSNFSNYNMAINSVWLAARYIKDPVARETIAQAMDSKIYNVTGYGRQPIEMKQSYFDLIYLLAMTDASAFGAPKNSPDLAILANAVETFKLYPEAPLFEEKIENCDESEIAALSCVAVDGKTRITLLGYLGRNDDLIAEDPIPMDIRPRSNYYWRSNPYVPNGGGDGSRLLSGVDLRVAYWLGRWTEVK